MNLTRSALLSTTIVGVTCLAACGEIGSMKADEAVDSQHLELQSDSSSAASSDTPASVSIDARAPLQVLSSIAVGVNAAAWDGDLVDSRVPDLIEDAGVQLMRYPGGSTSNNYHWISNTPDDPNVGGTDPSANFDAFMSVVGRARARAMITVNYGSGTATEAADWVRYANGGCGRYNGPVPTYPGASRRGHDYGIRYWEIGNELYGDGTYGATWEVNHKAHDPATYAQGVVEYSAAMKAVDPSIRIGAVLTAPGNWPHGQTNEASPKPWNDTVLAKACGSLDFVSVHWYPQGPSGESDADLLASPQNGQATAVSYTPSIPEMVATLKAELAQYCGAHAKAIQIMVTETNSVSYNPGKQTTSLTNALFLSDQVMTWLENGVTNVDWWALHNSPFDGNADPALYGEYSFGDYGILSRGSTSSGGAVEPPAQTPFPAYYGLQMLSHLGHAAGSQSLAASSSVPLVTSHAVKQVNGKIHVLLINKDPSAAYSVSVSLSGASARGNARVFSYGKDTPSIQSSSKQVRGSSFAIRLAPYSVTTVQLP
jgi:alpha-L-arabinofuranosidase